MKIYRDAKLAHQLDRHIDEYLKHMRADVKEGDIVELKKDAVEFEHHVHSEIAYLFAEFRKELDLYRRVLKSLHRFKAEMEVLVNQNPKYKSYADSEVKYVDLLIDSIEHKIDSFEVMLKRMK